MKANTGQALLILGMLFFVGGAVCLVAGCLPVDTLTAMGALALILIGAGAGVKRKASQ